MEQLQEIIPNKPIDILIEALKDLFNVAVFSGDGKVYADFIDGKTMPKDHIFISYTGFTLDYTEAGEPIRTKSYIMFIKTPNIEDDTDNMIDFLTENNLLKTQKGEYLFQTISGDLNYDYGYTLMQYNFTLRQI